MLGQNNHSRVDVGGKLVFRQRRSSGIDVLALLLQSCIAVVREPELLNLQER
jgi:hypothetical protein